MGVGSAHAWRAVFCGALRGTPIEHVLSLLRVLLCARNKYIFNEMYGIYLLEWLSEVQLNAALHGYVPAVPPPGCLDDAMVCAHLWGGAVFSAQSPGHIDQGTSPWGRREPFCWESLVGIRDWNAQSWSCTCTSPPRGEVKEVQPHCDLPTCPVCRRILGLLGQMTEKGELKAIGM